MGLHVAQMTGQAAMRVLRRGHDDASVDHRPRRLRTGPGCRADLVLLETRDPVEAIRLRATRLAVVRGGRIVATTPSSRATLDLPGRPSSVDGMPPRS